MKILLYLLVLACFIFPFSETKVSFASSPESSLSLKQQSIVPIASFTAAGDISNLKNSINEGLDNGLTVNETKEIIVHLYAYCGFPRALNGLNAVNQVLEERREKGINDHVGADATPLPKDFDALKTGTDVQTKISGGMVDLTALSPAIDEYLKTHLFGDLFARDVLNYQEREIATISALGSMNGTQDQFRAHLKCGLNVGLSTEQLRSIVNLLDTKINSQLADKNHLILDEILSTKS